ncbi:MAG: hypothetical protein QFF03_09760 [Pseudomonadota bacterium]|nr:hypothetical protein [Pseudomonadota bacterium]
MIKTTLYRWMAAMAFLASASALADPLSEKIAVGLTRDAVVALFGEEPELETCKTVLGLKSCVLIWERGIFPKLRYEVNIILGRVARVDVVAKR